MQSGVIRGYIRNEFITHHSTLSNHRPERILAHPARFLLGLPQISQIYTDNSSLQATVLYSSGLTAKNSEGGKSSTSSSPSSLPSSAPSVCRAASDILVLPQISRIYTDNLVASNGYHQTSMKKLRRSQESVKICAICGRQTLTL